MPNFTAPDGGYGWVVACAACVANICIIGFFKSYTVFYAAIRETFPDSSAYHASWIPALFSSLQLITAPVSGALCQRFSARPVTIMGGLLCFCGLFLSSFATSLNHLIFAIGVLTGLGGGFVTTPSILIVNKYFDKRRAFASGICMSGNALGSFIMPPLTEFLLQEYGFRGTLVIMAAIQLNLVVTGFCFRPTAVHAIVQEKYRRKMVQGDKKLKNVLPIEEMSNEVHEMKKKSRKRGSISSFGIDLEIEVLPLSNDIRDARSSPRGAASRTSNEQLRNYYSRETDEDSDSESSVHSLSDLKLSIDNHLHDEEFMEKIVNTQTKSQMPESGGTAEHFSLLQRSASEAEMKKRLTDSSENQLSVNRGVVSASAKDMNALNYSSSDTTLEILHNNNENKCKDDQCVSCPKKKSRTGKSFYFIRKIFGTFFDFEVLRTAPMILMSISGFFVKMGVPHTMFYLHALFISTGADSDIVTPVISGTSLVDVAGRLGVGALADTRIIPATFLYFGCCALAGSCIICIPFATTTATFAAAMSGYCLGLGSWSVLLPTILARNHGSDKLPASIGFVRMLMAGSNFLSPQISGALVDFTDSYASCYYFMGTSVLVASFLPLLSPGKEQTQKRDNVEEETEEGEAE